MFYQTFSFFAALEKNTYQFAGKVIAYSLVHNGPACNFFSGLLFEYVTSHSDSSSLDTMSLSTLEEIGDYDIRSRIRKVRTFVIAFDS